MSNQLIAPFPYFGGKRRWAQTILERLEPCTVYVEPFAGSLAVLLASKPHKREIVCDTDGHIANFWRSIRAEPDKVAYYADYPTFHQDLTARHKWLVEWARTNSHRLVDDADYYDAKAAGWWCWGISLWIGGEFCRDRVEDGRTIVTDAIPHFSTSPSGRGVSAQRMQYQIDLGNVKGELPLTVGTGQRLFAWFYEIAERLSHVIVLNRSWESALTPTLLMQHASAPSETSVSVLLDPPYRMDITQRSSVYKSESLKDIAIDAFDWAVEHGNEYRIAYCCHEGDFSVPEGWTYQTMEFKAHRVERDSRSLDCVMFSPACVENNSQMKLLEV